MSSGSRSSEPGARRPPFGSGLDRAQQVERLAYFDIGPADVDALLRYRAVGEATVDRVVADFYEYLLKFPELEGLLREEPGRIAKLQGMQRDYFLSMTDGRFDEAYFESRLRVGDAHQRIGLRPVWYIGAFSVYLRLALRALVDATGEGASNQPIVEALVKTVFLDMSLAMYTYIYGGFVSREVAGELERAARVAEETLQARAEVERAREDLTSMVVHDLKNPVNGISMMIQLALRKGAELPESQRNYLLQIDRTCREMMRLIQNLLEIAKIEEGKMPVAREPIVLAEISDEVAHEYGPVAEQTGRSVAVAVGTDLPAVLGDRALLKRVLVNLVVNALCHSGSAEVRIEGTLGDDTVELCVADRGHGIPVAEQRYVFEKFRTVRRSAADDPATDTGLGLPFCKLAVEGMGGRITLRSTPGEGSTFAVTLPIHRGGA